MLPLLYSFIDWLNGGVNATWADKEPPPFSVEWQIMTDTPAPV